MTFLEAIINKINESEHLVHLSNYTNTFYTLITHGYIITKINFNNEIAIIYYSMTFSNLIPDHYKIVHLGDPLLIDHIINHIKSMKEKYEFQY